MLNYTDDLNITCKTDDSKLIVELSLISLLYNAADLLRIQSHILIQATKSY